MRSLFKQAADADAHRGAVTRGAARPAAPVQIVAMAERTSGRDESLGALLVDMRLALGLTPGELALRLGANVDLIMILEQGRLRALPHWEETQRVIAGLCALHRVDPRPILQRIYAQTRATHRGAPPERSPGALHQAAVAQPGGQPARVQSAEPVTRRNGPRARQNPPNPEQSADKGEGKSPRKRRKARPIRGSGRALMAVAGPMVLIAAAVWTVQAQPRALREAIEVLPASLAQPMLGGLDALAVRLAPRRDGLRWIEVSDPSTRKADRLQSAGAR